MRRLLTVVTGVGLCAFAFAAHAEAKTSSSGANDTWYQFGGERSASQRPQGTRPARSSRRTGSTSARRGTRRQTARSTRTARTGSAPSSFLRRGAASASRACLTPAARALLGRIEAQFGQMQVISTCRPGARVAGTGRISRHASGNAVDFNANGKKAQVVRWLIANHRSGGTMTYAGMSHIHVDIGPRFVALNSGGRGRVAFR